MLEKYFRFTFIKSLSSLFILAALFPSALRAQNALPVDTIKSYFTNGHVSSAIPYYQNRPEGIGRFYFESGVLKEERTYQAGVVSGTVKRYDATGTLRELFTIENGKREGASSVYDERGNFVEDKMYYAGRLQPPDTTFAAQVPAEPVYDTQKNVPPPVAEETRPAILDAEAVASNDTLVIDLSDSAAVQKLHLAVVPSPLHGMKNFYDVVFYPSKAVEKKIQGTVKIKALLDQYGDVLKTEIVKGIGYGCEEAANIAVYYTKFIPAVRRTEAIPCYVIFPVTFTLDIVQQQEENLRKGQLNKNIKAGTD
jgi:hypothetical protein